MDNNVVIVGRRVWGSRKWYRGTNGDGNKIKRKKYNNETYVYCYSVGF